MTAIPTIALQIILVLLVILAGLLLWRMHRDKHAPSMNDLLTSTDKRGKVRLDARKCFEAGSFCLSTWIMVYLTVGKGMTIEFFTVYLGVWTTARWLRDREKRLEAKK